MRHVRAGVSFPVTAQATGQLVGGPLCKVSTAFHPRVFQVFGIPLRRISVLTGWLLAHAARVQGQGQLVGRLPHESQSCLWHAATAVIGLRQPIRWFRCLFNVPPHW